MQVNVLGLKEQSKRANQLRRKRNKLYFFPNFKELLMTHITVHNILVYRLEKKLYC